MFTHNYTFLSFNTAQKLYSNYATIRNDHILQKELKNLVGLSRMDFEEVNNIREIYNNIIMEYYPSEVTIKSNFVKNILIKGNKSIIYELPVAGSRVDLCSINSRSIAYEIKTDLDNLSRLEKQIQNYSKAFELVYVICSDKRGEQIANMTPISCGVYTYSFKNGRYKFMRLKEAKHSENIDAKSQLEIFNRKELIDISKYISFESKSDIIASIISKRSATEINRMFKKVIKNRYIRQSDFLSRHSNKILEIDYQWFYKNMSEPDLIYSNN